MEGNLISYKVLLTKSGDIVTELAMLPDSKIEAIFDNYDSPIVRKVISEAKVKLATLHEHLEKEIEALLVESAKH